MIDWDWTSFGTVNAWQTLITICVIILALWVVIRFLRKFWPGLQTAISFVNALGKLPQFMIETRTFIADFVLFIERTDKSVARIKHEVEYNNGSSVKDAVKRVEIKVDEVHTTLTAADDALRRELENTRPTTPKPAVRPRKPSKPKGAKTDD